LIAAWSTVKARGEPGVGDTGDHYIVASGEADLACRITHMPKALLA